MGGLHPQRIGQQGQLGQREMRMSARGCGRRARWRAVDWMAAHTTLCIRRYKRQSVPPTAGRRRGGLHGRERQAVFGACHGHIQHVELFALAGLLLGGQGRLGAGGRVGFAGQKHKAGGHGLLAGPVHQHAHGLGFLGARVGVEQQHAARLQPLGAVYGEQANRLRIDPARGAHAAFFHGAHKRVRREVAATIVLQRGRQQGAQVGQHRRALRGGRSRCKTRQHITVLVDGVQGVVRRQGVDPRLILSQNRP